VACNAGGPRCLKYGVTGDYVMGLTVVLADGRVLQTGGKAIKNVTGYDLKNLFVGSEGTLGIVTEVLLKLIPLPKYARTAMAVYPMLEGASVTVNNVLRAGVLPATMELMDNTTIGTIEEYLHLGLPTDAAAILIIEVDGGDEATVTQEIETIGRVCRESGASEVRVAKTEAERNDLWRGRRSVSPSLARRRPNKLGEDISVPARGFRKRFAASKPSATSIASRLPSSVMPAMAICIRIFCTTNATRPKSAGRTGKPRYFRYCG